MADPIRAIGVVGLGAMGLPIATRIHQSGIAVRAVDSSTTQVERARAAGMNASEDPSALVGADAVLVVVATGGQLLDVLSAPPFSDGRMTDTVAVVMSTVGTQAVVEATAIGGARNISLIDCPITGGVVGARDGSLVLFAAGDPSVIEALTPVLAVLGQLRQVGPSVGDGQSFKLVNQLLASVHLAAAAEALGLARRLGLNLDTVLDLLPRGSATSHMLVDRGPRMIQSAANRPVVTHLSIFLKDSGLVADAAAAVGYDAPLINAAHQLFTSAAEHGLSSLDDSSVIDLYDPETSE